MTLAEHDIKELLEKAKDALISSPELINVDDANIYIAVSLDVVPSASAFPCIGIKDGSIERERISDWAWNVHMELHIGIYQLLQAGEKAAMGTDPQVFGLLDLVTEVRTVLDHNYLNVAGVYMQSLAQEEESELLDATEMAVQRKILTYTYSKRVYRTIA